MATEVATDGGGPGAQHPEGDASGPPAPDPGR